MTTPRAEALREDLLARLFEPAERWGWEFAPPHDAAPSPEAGQPPVYVDPPGPYVAGLEHLRTDSLSKIWKPITGGLFVLGGLAMLGISVGAGLFSLLVGAAFFAWWYLPYRSADTKLKNIMDAYAAEVAQQRDDYRRVYGDWQRRVAHHDEAEQDRIASGLDFYPLDASTAPRVDVFGGTAAGWTSLLATGGASLLATGAGVLLVDLSELAVGAGLVMVANGAGVPAEVRELPRSLETLGPLAGLDPIDAAELLADAFDADRRGGSDPTLRAIDLSILRAVTRSISMPLTFPRLAAALRIINNQSAAVDEGTFAAYEVQALQQAMFDLGQRDRIADQASFLGTELETLAGRDAARPAEPAELAELAGAQTSWWGTPGLRVLATTSQGPGGARRKNLTDRVLIQVLLHRLRDRGRDGAQDALVIAGADHVGRESLKALIKQAELARIRLVLLFEHLSDDAEKLIGTGGSATIFMRLGNSREAALAADHIGKGHRFVLSQLTEQIGRNFNEGLSNTYGEQDGTSHTLGKSGGKHSGPGGSGTNSGWSDSTTTSHSSTWSNTVNVSAGMSHTAGSALQREKDYTVEPTVLQSLAPTAFILVGTGEGEARVRPGDCNPGVVLLPRVSGQAREITAGRTAPGPSYVNAGAQQIPAPQQGYQNPYGQQAYPGQPGYPQQAYPTGPHQQQPPYGWPGRQR
ncbi:hypothetical protein [Pseudofrankia sp. BMG5.37]|uniref:hypothetical protein n=1 Tax=Pseudofrankia sp. BMG5.37 TaxID=3050035 RepID=UPI0028939E7B|nr:hypothetical protein [Pseudofrankia sp. BMG5.37]MDT3440047.1 hypothetical protein [Pseudofrankia sp. BMG5.37]